MTFELCLLSMIFAHFVGDYVLKTEWLATTKGEFWYNMLVHCVLYTGSVGWVLNCYGAQSLLPGLVMVFGTHWFIDTWHCQMKKADSDEKGLGRYLLTDQLAHFVVLAILVFWYMY